MKASPSSLLMPSSLFFELKEEYYKSASKYNTFLVYEPVVVKAVCANERVLLSLNPGSLIIENGGEELLDLGACISLEYFWFKGSAVSWKLGEVPAYLEELARSSGFEIGHGNEVSEIGGVEGELSLRKPWHPGTIGLEEGLKCVGGEAEGDVLALCDSSAFMSVQGNKGFIGRIEESWRALPFLAFISSLR